MPTFLRFPVGGDMLVNTEHIISVQLVQRPAEQKDVDRAGHLFQLGQMMYQVRLRLPGCNSVDLEYPLEANRDTVYEEIIAVLNPTVINPFTPDPPTPSEKPARKPPPASPSRSLLSQFHLQQRHLRPRLLTASIKERPRQPPTY